MANSNKRCPCRDEDDWCSNQNGYCFEDDFDCPDCPFGFIGTP